MKYGPKKDRSPFTKLQRFATRQENLKKRQSGDGRKFKYKNKTSGDLYLPKPSEDGRTTIIKEAEFIGDSYFLCMVPECLLIVEDLNMKPEKLITEQPPTVTNEGQVEYVKQSKQQKLNENKPNKQEEILLNEDPVGGVVIAE